MLACVATSLSFLVSFCRINFETCLAFVAQHACEANRLQNVLTLYNFLDGIHIFVMSALA